MSGGEIAINFAELEQAAQELTTQAQAIEGLLTQEREVLTTLGGAWTGSGAKAWQAEQQRWQQKADDLNAALRQLSSAVAAVAEEMKKIESEAAASFG
jgi:early secretory antigenic target protein ESAT-6